MRIKQPRSDSRFPKKSRASMPVTEKHDAVCRDVEERVEDGGVKSRSLGVGKLQVICGWVEKHHK